MVKLGSVVLAVVQLFSIDEVVPENDQGVVARPIRR